MASSCASRADNASAAVVPGIDYVPFPPAHGGDDCQLRHMLTAGEQHEPQGSNTTPKPSLCGPESTGGTVRSSSPT
eukprot:50155-Eustigmatos_ZCMA.PRE.1